MNWEAEVEIRSVDGRTFHDIVVSTLTPGQAPEDAARDFARIIAQLVGAAEATCRAPSDAAIAPAKHNTRQNSEERSDDEALVDQLAAASRPKRRTNKAPARKGTSAPSSGSALSTGFNPLVNARLPRKR